MEEVQSMVATLTGDGSSYQKMMDDAKTSTKSTVGVIQQAGSQISNVGSAFTAFGQTALSALSMFGLASSAMGAFEKFSQMEKTLIRLRAAIQGNQQAVEPMVAEYENFAKAVADVTTQTKSQVMALLTEASVRGLSGQQAEAAVKNSIAIAAAMGGEAESYIEATSQLAKGNVELIKRQLKMRGVKDESEILATIQQRLALGWDAEQKIVATAAGQLDKLKKSFADMTKEIGGMIATAILPVIRAVKSAIDWFKQLDPAVRKTVVALLGVAAVAASWGTIVAVIKPLAGFLLGPLKLVSTILSGMPTLWSAIASVVSTVGSAIAGIIPFVMGLLNPLKWLGLAFTALKAVALGALGFIGALFSPVTIAIGLVAVAVTIFVNKMGGWAAAWEKTKEAAVVAWDYIKGKFDEFLTWVQPFWERTKALAIDAWNVVLQWGTQAWDTTQQKALEFFDWIQPIWKATKDLLVTGWQAVKEVAVATWDAIKVAAEVTWDFIMSAAETAGNFINEVWTSIFGSASINWTAIRQVIVEAIWFAEFTIKNFGAVAEYTWTTTLLKFVEMANEIQHFFVETIPAALRWFGENWDQVFKAAFNWTIEALGTLIENIISVFKSIPWGSLWEGFKTAAKNAIMGIVGAIIAIPALVSGIVKIDDIIGPETVSGVKAEIKKIPGIFDTEMAKIKPFKVPDREIGEWEQKLQDLADEQGNALDEAWQEFKQSKMFTDDWEDEIIAPDAAKAVMKKALDVGTGIGNNMNKGFESTKFDAALVGTTEALARIQDQRDRMAKDVLMAKAVGTSPVETAKVATEAAASAEMAVKEASAASAAIATSTEAIVASLKQVADTIGEISTAFATFAAMGLNSVITGGSTNSSTSVVVDKTSGDLVERRETNKLLTKAVEYLEMIANKDDGFDVSPVTI